MLKAGSSFIIPGLYLCSFFYIEAFFSIIEVTAHPSSPSTSVETLLSASSSSHSVLWAPASQLYLSSLYSLSALLFTWASVSHTRCHVTQDGVSMDFLLSVQIQYFEDSDIIDQILIIEKFPGEIRCMATFSFWSLFHKINFFQLKIYLYICNNSI